MGRLLANSFLLPFLFIAPEVSAQSWPDYSQTSLQEPSAPVTAFVRFAPQPRASKSTPAWQYGLSFAGTAQNSRTSAFNNPMRGEASNSGFEVRLGRSDLGLWSRGGNGQLLASFNDAYDKLGATEITVSKKGNIRSVFLIGAAVVGGLVLIAAASGDNSPVVCSGNTVPNPIKGTCEPI